MDGRAGDSELGPGVCMDGRESGIRARQDSYVGTARLLLLSAKKHGALISIWPAREKGILSRLPAAGRASNWTGQHLFSPRARKKS